MNGWRWRKGHPVTLPDLEPFLALRRFVSIAHHVPGRIRLKLDMAALAQLPKRDPRPFMELFKRIDGVTLTRINGAALSVVVEYDPCKIAVPVWSRLLTAEKAEIEEILTHHMT